MKHFIAYLRERKYPMQLREATFDVNALVQIQSAFTWKKMREGVQMHTVIRLQICVLTEQEELSLGNFTY